MCEVGTADAQFRAYRQIIDLADAVLAVYDRNTPPTGGAEDSALAYAMDVARKPVLALGPPK